MKRNQFLHHLAVLFCVAGMYNSYQSFMNEDRNTDFWLGLVMSVIVYFGLYFMKDTSIIKNLSQKKVFWIRMFSIVLLLVLLNFIEFMPQIPFRNYFLGFCAAVLCFSLFYPNLAEDPS